jgi:hypothetical protein
LLVSSAVVLGEAERVLREHSPAEFAATIDAAPECVEFVYAVEEKEAWKAGYPSLEAFYSAHEARHPCIRVYGAVRREIETAGPFEEGPGGTIPQRIERHCREAQQG